MQKDLQRIAFYFAAHEDDWQLFMNPAAFYDVIDANTKTVFIHMTAGDAGLGTNSGGRKHPYYAARENGAESAIRSWRIQTIVRRTKRECPRPYSTAVRSAA